MSSAVPAERADGQVVELDLRFRLQLAHQAWQIAREHLGALHRPVAGRCPECRQLSPCRTLRILQGQRGAPPGSTDQSPTTQ